MGFPYHILPFIIIPLFSFLPYMITAQQPYSPSNCRRNTSSSLGYYCNGLNTSCKSYLIYRTQPPYNTISSIATLLSANPTHISAINKNIPENYTIATNTKVIIPITCSCAGKFYQTNTTHIVKPYENYYVIARNIFEGLTTCHAIRTQKISPFVVNIFANERLLIPLRCACPSKTQVKQGIRFLLSYPVEPGDVIGLIATSFGADVGQTLVANEKTEQDSSILGFTTVLVPLKDPLNGSRMVYPAYVAQSPSSPPSILPRETPSSSGSSSKKWGFFGFGVVVGGVVVVVGMVLFFMLGLRKKTDPIVPSPRFEAQEKAIVTQKDQAKEAKSLEFLGSLSKFGSLKVYSFEELQGATRNFSSDNWIKGSVYKGEFNDDYVAIKRMQGDVNKEIDVLNKIHHFNLIKLLGVCYDDGVWYFVYEYAGNGALSDWIYQENPNKKTLCWRKRMQVACDVATGLNYLHSYTSPPHVHKDIRSCNILLNHDYRAKVSKFGYSRPIKGNELGDFTLTKHIVGTKGYLAPEYLENGVVSPMLDVYAFGVVLLEILTGKDIGCLYEGVSAHLLEIIEPVLAIKDGSLRLNEVMDSSLGDNYPKDIAIAMIKLVERCLNKDAGSRPTMDEIVQVLLRNETVPIVCESSSSTSMFSI
ncbi:unnamed protein product [Amaranthus hypochondriacus]